MLSKTKIINITYLCFGDAFIYLYLIFFYDLLLLIPNFHVRIMKDHQMKEVEISVC